MRIGWVGGIQRQTRFFEEAAAAAGHTFEVHSGQTGGRGAEGLAGLVERSDLVIIVIEVNSHGGALIAKDLARRYHRRAVTIRKPSVSAFTRILKELPPTISGHQ